VHAGDTLSRIALRAYGTADAVDRILEANLGQRMSDGVVFADPNQIHTGWTLVLPPPARAVTDTGGASSQYVVQPGDSLSSIAARQVGSATRWPELYALNGDQLVSPSLLPVGLHLQLPGGAMPGQASGASTSGAHS
jgi:nucleoid-associated protein YgaU